MNDKNRNLNFLLIGFGPHSKRIFHPIFEKIYDEPGLALKAAIDLKSKQKRIEAYLDGKTIQPKMYYLDDAEPIQDLLTSNTIEQLDSIVKHHDINVIIIATEPLVHRAYATWALRAGLSILMDKPISANMNVSSEIASAVKIAEDYYFLNQEYQRAKKRAPNIIFSLLAQRRYLERLEGEATGLLGKPKSKCFFEFVRAVHGDISSEQMKSDFSQHEHGAVLVSAVYQSMCNQLSNKSPLIKMPLKMSGDNLSVCSIKVA